LLHGAVQRARHQWQAQTLGVRLVVGYAVLFTASVALLAALAYGLLIYFLQQPDRSFMEDQAHELAAAYQRGGAEALRATLEGAASDERRQEILVRLLDGGGRTLLLYNPDNWRPADLDSMQSVFLTTALPVVLLALLGGTLLAYRALRPAQQLVRTFQDIIETGNVHTRALADDMRGEFAEMVHLFNRMLARLERLVTGMRDTLEASDAVLETLNAIMDVAEAETGAMQLHRDPCHVAASASRAGRCPSRRA